MRDSSFGFAEELEDFLGVDNIHTSAANGIKWLVSSDTSDTAFGIVDSLPGGVAQATLAATNNNMCEIGEDNFWIRAQDGQVIVEFRFKLDVITNIAFNLGLNDDASEDSNTLPVELATTAFTANSATWIGFVFDTDANNDFVHAFWVDDGTACGEAIADLKFNFAPTAAQWASYRIHLTDRGSGKGVHAVFSIVDHDGTPYQKEFDTNIDRDVFLVRHAGVENRSATAHVPEIDLIYAKKSRAE